MKLFVISDIHSFYTPMKKALDEKGFEINNPDHLLIVCGDLFDRGEETLKVLDYINSVPNKILIKGNHEILLMDMLYRMWPEWHDKSNGTMRTFDHLIDRFILKDENNEYDMLDAYETVKKEMKKFQEQFVNYFETKNYIFVHSWIPLEIFYTGDELFPIKDRTDWKEKWRDASQYEWNEAMWVNPFDTAQDGLNKTGKTIVFGHWHCSYGWYLEKEKKNEPCGEFGDFAIWEPYINEEQGIIGIDRCTAYTGECNVLILEDDLLDS